MSGYRSPLDAYREDLARAHGKSRLAAGDEFWIILSTGLRRLSQAPARSRAPAARRLAAAIHALATGFSDQPSARLTAAHPARTEDSGRPAAVAAALAHFGDQAHVGTIVMQVRGAAADAEEAGAVGLAREMLTDLRSLTPHAPPLARGLILLQLGRVCRTLGDLNSAGDLLRAAGDLGRAEDIPELEAREALGLGVLARTRGNYPEARTFFERSLQGASTVGLPDVEGMAHQGLMIVTAESSDFDAAMVHGWRALSSAREQGAREAEALGNLAHLCAKLGYPAAAIGAFSAALARTTAPRLRLPVLAGLVVSAARTGNHSLVDRIGETIAAEANDAFPFETSGAWLALARARRTLGDALGSDAAAKKAAVIAGIHGFYEITHRIEQEVSPGPAALTGTALRVVRSLESWSENPKADLALSTPTG